MACGDAVRAVLICTLLGLLAQPALAGTGTYFDDIPDRINLNLYYTYTPTDMAVMRSAFQEASALLYNATNGQLHFGVIRASTNAAFQDRADVWVNSGASGAFSAVGHLGDAGYHMTLYQDRHRWIAEDGPGGDERGQFGIVHELGHYAFNLRDEYPIAGGGYPGACCVDDTGTIACIMDGGTQIQPNNRRTEWCTPHGGGLSTAHVTTPNTPQQAQHGQSCWETIVDYVHSTYGATLTLPAAVDITAPAGLPPIGWVVIGNRLRLVLAVDRSGSMSVDNKEPLAKQAAVLFTDLCRPDEGEFLGVVSFSNSPTLEFPIDEVTTVPDTKAGAVAAINGISLQNMTALGDGLRTSLSQIAAAPADASVVEAIVVLSDGVHNFGTEAPNAVLPDLIARGVRVFTIGLGDPADPVYPLDEPTLLDIADQTGATYTHAPDAAGLGTIYTEYAAEVRGEGAFPEDDGDLGEEKEREHRVLVDVYSTEETFVLHWPFGPNAFALRLVRPDGVVVPAATAGDVRYSNMPFHVIYHVRKPMPGTWRLIVGAGRGLRNLRGAKAVYTTQAIAKAPGLCVRASARPNYSKPGQPVLLQATVAAANEPVAGVDVVGTIIGPDGSSRRIRLLDDGDYRADGDEKADDGVYSARFGDTKKGGTYRLKVRAESSGGKTAAPDEPDKRWRAKPISKFIRATSTTFSVGRAKVRPPRDERKQR